MAGASFRKRITLNNVVGAFTDEFSFIYEASQDRLTTTGILYEAEITSKGNVRFAGDFPVEKTRDFYQCIRSVFMVINPKQPMCDQINFNSNSSRPIVFEGEELKVVIIYQGKEIKTIFLPMESKQFHSKPVPQALVVPSLFSGIGSSNLNEGSFLVRVSLEKVSPVREIMKEFFGKLGQNLIAENISRKSSYTGRFSFSLQETDSINFNSCDDAKFFSPRSVVTLGHLLCRDDLQLVVRFPLNMPADYSIVPNKEPEIIIEYLDSQNMQERIEFLRLLLFKLEDNIPLTFYDYHFKKI